MHRHGIITDGGVYHEFDSPYDLWPSRIAELKAADSSFCGCNLGAALRLAVVTSEAGQITPHIRCVDGSGVHSYDCIFRRALMKYQSGAGVFRDGIFDVGDGDGAAHAFNVWARGHVSRAYSSAFIAGDARANTEAFLRNLAQPSVFSFYPPTEPVCIAKKFGQKLCVGFCDDFVAPQPDLEVGPSFWPLPVWLRHERLLEAYELKVSIDLLVAALSAVSIMGRPVAGPYVLVALLDEVRGWVTRLFLIPILTENGTICTVDSGRERAALTPALRERSRIYKPLQLADLNSLHPCFRSQRREEVHYRYRPDWLCFDDGVEVIELCGFPTDQSYMRTFVRKVRYWQQLELERHIRFTVVY